MYQHPFTLPAFALVFQTNFVVRARACFMCAVNMLFSASLCSSNPTGSKLPKLFACADDIKGDAVLCLCRFPLQNRPTFWGKLPCFFPFNQEFLTAFHWFKIISNSKWQFSGFYIIFLWFICVWYAIFFFIFDYFFASSFVFCQFAVANFIIWLFGSENTSACVKLTFSPVSMLFPRHLPVWFEWAERLISSDILYFSRVWETAVQFEWINNAPQAIR